MVKSKKWHRKRGICIRRHNFVRNLSSRSIILLFGSCLLILSLFNQNLIFAKLYDWNLISKASPVTELFFSDLPSIPRLYRPNQKYNLAFTIVNGDSMAKNFNYKIIQKNDSSKQEVLLTENSVVVDAAGSKIVQNTINYADTGDSATVLVSLSGYDQIINFKLNKDLYNE